MQQNRPPPYGREASGEPTYLKQGGNNVHFGVPHEEYGDRV